MTNFWESAFTDKQLMWGLGPTVSASRASETFSRSGVQRVLIPGIGYGRNANPFLERGMSVTGIEISGTAIELARSRLGLELPIIHGSVTDMPFDRQIYGGIYCHGLAYLLDARGRRKLIRDCYRQLKPGGRMVFTLISKNAPMYAQGPKLGEDWYERLPGVPMYFYDAASVKREFGPYGLVEFSDIDEPTGNAGSLPFINVVCRRDAVTVESAEAVGQLHAGRVEVKVNGALQHSQVEAIAQALETSKTTILTMGGCQITEAGAKAIARALVANTALNELWLFDNEIGDHGAAVIGDALRANRSLATLCVDDNRVSDAGAKAIGNALRTSTSLVELGLGRNLIGDDGAAAIGEGLAVNDSVLALSLNHNRISDSGATGVAAGLRTNTALKTLRLSNNAIGDIGADALRAEIARSPTLRVVGFENNPASPALHAAIKAAVELNGRPDA